MDFSNLLLDPSKIVAAVGAASLLGLFIWWLMRKRQTRIWLPTVRILDMETRLLPKMVLQPPPWLAFICFLICALVMTSFAMKPRRQLFTPFEPSSTRIHIFADYSPSVSAYITEEEYSDKLVALWTSLREGGRITISTSHGATFFEPANEGELRKKIVENGFQRAGLKLGSAIKIQMEELGDIDRLFIVSDRDQHSWNGFNWRYLLDEMDVQFVDVSTDKVITENLFINQIVYLSTPTSQISEWDVEISRRGKGSVLEGRVSAIINGKELGEFGWIMPADKKRVTVRVSWPIKKLKNIDNSKHIEWKISSSAKDQLNADDYFRSNVKGLKKNVVIISESTGEMLLDDPVHQLQIGLEVLGFKVKRYDQLKQPGPDPKEYPLWIIVGGLGTGVDRFCPKSLEAARRDPGNILKYQEQGAAQPMVWLAPIVANAEYKEMCHCYHRIIMSKTGERSPSYCEDLTHRDHWIGLLPSLGAYQIGGDLGQITKSIAFNKVDQGSGMGMLAFTIPLKPSMATINHARFPILLKQLLVWQDLVESKGSGAVNNWPRVDDVTLSLWPKEKNKKTSDLITNVPLGESLLLMEKLADLPPRFTAAVGWSQNQLPVKKDREDPLPWLKFGAVVLIAMCFIEAFYGLTRAFFGLVKKRPATIIPVLFCLGLSGIPKAEAQVEVSILGYRSTIQFDRLAREVAHRTSLELKTRPSSFIEFNENALNSPWIWSKNLHGLRDANGVFKPSVATWLKRGGLLIIDGPASEADLEKLISTLEPKKKTNNKLISWRPIPPDHELMRSFYLLDALPACNNAIWRGFHFDGRLAILQIPMGFLEYLNGVPTASSHCAKGLNRERAIRVFVNMLMVALATDYKKDQIHLPEILKRLR
jgi:hypothetical protein